ncbi:unnamed protein product [Oikopleura dioica]|uniref:Uncharacterized protein n=1 Tax=Oikopleura dioica TaxID=34765 RepID=E4WSH8_OIKDI|nr:unnamed protein product [Oikopleura dioica]
MASVASISDQKMSHHRNQHLRQTFQNSPYSQGSSRSSMYHSFMPDAPAYEFTQQGMPRSTGGSVSSIRSESGRSSALHDFMSSVKQEEKEPETYSKVLNLIEARLDDQQDATKGLMTKAVTEIKEESKSNAADLSSMLVSMNERITELEGKITSKEDMSNNQKMLLGEIDKMVDIKAQKWYKEFRVPKKETVCLGVQCSMSQESIPASPEKRQRRRKRHISTPPASPSPKRISTGVQKRTDKKFISRKSEKAGLQFVDANRLRKKSPKKKVRYFSDRIGADEDEIFRSLRPRTPDKRNNAFRRIPTFFDEREEDFRVYPGTCPAKPRTKVSKAIRPSQDLPRPVIRNEPLDRTEVFFESSDDEESNRKASKEEKFVIPRRRKRPPTCSVYDFTSSYVSSGDETQISIQDTSEYGSQ